MCGIVGYVGHQESSSRPLEVVLEGLARLEYRGYDSAGVAVAGADGMQIAKRAGRLDNLREIVTGSPLAAARSAIGHTRWATHGGPTDTNAHPHVSFDARVAVVHNGIIENYQQLAAELTEQGIRRTSETDTEVAAHQLALELAKDGDLLAAMRRLAARLEGSFTLVALDAEHPDAIVAARRNSPLVVGMGEGENFLGSDVAAFVGQTRHALELGQDQIVRITADNVEVIDFDGTPSHGNPFEVDWDVNAAVKGGYDTFMDKEIHEEPTAVAETLRGRTTPDGNLQLDEMRIPEEILRSIDKIIVVACGTAAYAGHVAKYAIEHWCRIPVEVELAHEFRYRDPVVNERTLVVAISQSGETMDTLMAIRHAREQGSKVLAIVNTHGSTIARESDAVLYTHAGPEVAVASTKAFIAQITACYLLGLYLAELRGNKYVDEVATYLEELGKMPGRIQEVLAAEDEVRELARSMADTTSVLFLGRHVGFPVALEGALKLKELAYIHAEGFAAGELKHGPIALIEQDLPVFVIVPTPRRPLLHSKVISNLQEVRARGANTIVIAEEGDTDVEAHASKVFWVPRTTPTLMMPLVTVVPLQIFACELARVKGYDVDKPRNLAKSVTVE
ncbi:MULTISPECIES: glutamine--fructose-6-phosphate transaminase (isomerizing) [unclassified Actinobaculum]|uniref:glutamine--fructose-6-phosphate transaminase (isomerizing) n=1 Tax=unclassified Actinobaculum TaxID=2609299 RepID=UPI000D5270B8|nr:MULTISPECIES: glutamine--fructose-6-phosphate transaminase (isomerizing) [unclassified Actinobaculum]AWE42035.1 glutamine--fructose-6-phosphate transaminase (isomerizing) [Actinobaculum sp. 313]RTE50585.1 glutamine--fructose-6-phosphate transaminase (isomerizing) [Actinobaculum sp. 352]